MTFMAGFTYIMKHLLLSKTNDRINLKLFNTQQQCPAEIDTSYVAM